MDLDGGKYTEEQVRAHQAEWRERKFSGMVLLVVLVAPWIANLIPEVREGALELTSKSVHVLLLGMWSLGVILWIRRVLRCPGCGQSVAHFDGLVRDPCPRCGLQLESEP